MQERRKFIRINESLKVRYQVLRSFRLVTSHSKDFSEGGIRLPVIQRLQPGMVLEIEIYFPQYQKPAVATGEVVWIREIEDLKFPFVVGIKFINIDAASLNKIRNYIRSKDSDKYIGWIE
jgi:c-di-GMP-binding flagellar brake protein YcgR